MEHIFHFDLLPENAILIILTDLLNSQDETNTLRYNIANLGSIRMLNLTLKASPMKVRIVDFMDTRLWLRLLIRIGIFDNQTHEEWHKIIKEYLGRIVREGRYTSRVHDLIDISKSKLSPIMRDYARCLLYHLIREDSDELERSFLLGEMNDIPSFTNDTIVECIRNKERMNIIKYWDVRNVTDMNSLSLDSIDKQDITLHLELTYWDTSNVTNMSRLMKDVSINIRGITNWNTCRVKNMSYMFSFATSFNQLLDWNTRNVQRMNDMFEGATSFNKPLQFDDTSNVIDMSNMFRYASSFNQLLKWDTSNVKTMTQMFQGASNFNQPLQWDTSNVTSMAYMFEGASLFNQPLEWDTSKVITMSGIFSFATSFDQPLVWKTHNVQRMNDMFEGATSFNKPLQFDDTSNVIDMSRMFKNARTFNQKLPWDTSNVQYMARMFQEATSFNQPLHWDKRNVKNMLCIFLDSQGRWV